jgi:O-acetyl-ADP-ribose deacetylase (regulator of RNase III)
VLVAAGEALLPALKNELATSTRSIGDAVITDAFGLKARGIKWIVHVISIIKNTPEGAWCPEPNKLPDGVTKALQLATKKGAQSIAFSMLATGEGRVTPDDAAKLMLRGIRAFKGHIDVTFALPTPRDHTAVQRALAATM